MNLNYIDLIILALLVSAAVSGIWKGFIHQLFGIAALFLGVYCAYHFSYFAAFWIDKWIHPDKTTIAVMAFTLTFLVVLFGVILAGRLTEKIIKVVLLGWLNRILGLVFSLAKTTFILSVCIWILRAVDQIWPFFPHQDAKNSILFAPLEQLAHNIFPYLSSFLASL
ncbi:MAG: CvpA family protein [Bacteroidales bacterium]|nr:CvpA family protein [Bacteroidales bacterium]